MVLFCVVASVAVAAAQISIGTNNVVDVQVGNSAINQVYVGADLVWTRPAPVITSFSPSYGSVGGIKPTYGEAGSVVSVSGSRLRTATIVQVGGVNCSSFSVISDSLVRCVLPAGLVTGEKYSISVTTPGGTATVDNILTYDSLYNIYEREMLAIETVIRGIIDSVDVNNRIGTALTPTNAVTILGINYGADWYKVTAAELLAAYPDLDISHADYIVKYDTVTAGAVQSIPGEIIGADRIHTFNYFGDGFYVPDLSTAVDDNSTKTGTEWGEFSIVGGTGTYDENGGLVLGTQYGSLTIDQTKPIGEQYTIGFTVKGAVPQTRIPVSADSTYPRTIVAISPANASYLSWIGIVDNYLQVYSYYSGGALSGKDYDTLNEPMAGFTSIDLTTVGDFNNKYLNVYVAAERKTGATVTYTRIYINGQLVRTINSGAPVLGYATMSLGDLRAGRGLKYMGSVYDFTLYSEALDNAAIQQNWEYTSSRLGITP